MGPTTLLFGGSGFYAAAARLLRAVIRVRLGHRRRLPLAGHPITPFMPLPTQYPGPLHPERPFTNLSQKMPADKPPNLKAQQGFAR